MRQAPLRLNRRQAIGAVLGSLSLAGCGNSASFRYKLTLTVETPEGVKSGFGVVQMEARNVSVPASGTPSRAIGEAIYVDLGKGQRPIIALVGAPVGFAGRDLRWAEGKPNVVALLNLYGEPAKPGESFLDHVRQVGRLRGSRALTVDQLPLLVTFADINDPKSIIRIDPHDLPSALQRDVRWKSITFEITSEPVSTGIQKRLPWLLTLRSTLGGTTVAHYSIDRSGNSTAPDLAKAIGPRDFFMGSPP